MKYPYSPQALKTLHRRKTYKKLIVYVDACKSASMFQDALPDDIDVYAMTASNATGDAYYTYFPCYPSPFIFAFGSLFSSKLTESELKLCVT